MIVNPEAVGEARNRWVRRHGDASCFDANMEWIGRARSRSDIVHPTAALPWYVMIHNSATEIFELRAEGDTILKFRIVATRPEHIDIKIINHGVLKEIVRLYSARRASSEHVANAKSAAATSPNIVGVVVAGGAVAIAVARQAVAIVKDSLDIRQRLRERKERSNGGDQK